MTNRLVLNLSQVANTREENDLQGRTRTDLDGLAFAQNSMLGNIGGPVYSHLDDLDDDEEAPRVEEHKAEKTAGQAVTSGVGLG